MEENLQEKASGTETTEPFIVDNKDDDMTTVTAFGVSFYLLDYVLQDLAPLKNKSMLKYLQFCVWSVEHSLTRRTM